jgi:DNA-binding response OmpR family regulator
MTEAHPPRTIHVVAPDDALIRALAEQRPVRDGWRFAPLDAPPDPDGLIIIDFVEPEARAQALRAVRARGFDGPVLLLGAQGPGQLPEDEPIPRPVRLGALLARIDAHWAPAGAFCRLGPYESIPAERVLRHVETGAVVRLTELERRLLAFLAECGGAPVDRDRLLRAVWGYGPGLETHTVETHIWRLRQKIETDDPATHFLLTEPGGYRLTVARAGEDG